MASTPTGWSSIDVATADVIDQIMTATHVSNRQVDRETNGDIGYSRMRWIRQKKRAPMRIGEFFTVCSICGVDPMETLERIQYLASQKDETSEVEPSTLSPEERAALALQRANSGNYDLAAFEGDADGAESEDW
ncbi:hypothetical protein [Bifidobacterium cuniculi]|uniref:hypothetical protein n=1 Tax=Bifidobacterium cuniculi TaxID=1688 RepID=UPI00126A682D|nr:hypothetical protein [Bifidobacterium cuniculi]